MKNVKFQTLSYPIANDILVQQNKGFSYSFFPPYRKAKSKKLGLSKQNL